MNIFQICRTFFLAALFLTAAGCGNYVGKEKSHPLFVKASSCRDAGDFEEAARYFREFINICPTSPRAHYEMAVLCCDNLNDPFRAVYHYNRCLELGGMGKTDDEAIRKSIELARKKAFQLLSRNYESADTVKIRDEAIRLRKHYDQYVAYAEKLRKSLDKYVAFTEELKKQNAQLRTMLEKVKTAPPEEAPEAPAQEKPPVPGTKEAEKVQGPAVEPEKESSPDPQNGWNGDAKPVAASPGSTAGKLQGPEKEEKTSAGGSSFRYTVKSGDNLYRISKQLYGSSKYYKLILEANSKTIGSNGNLLRPGQVLVIPKLSAQEGKAP